MAGPKKDKPTKAIDVVGEDVSAMDPEPSFLDLPPGRDQDGSELPRRYELLADFRAVQVYERCLRHLQDCPDITDFSEVSHMDQLACWAYAFITTDRRRQARAAKKFAERKLHDFGFEQFLDWIPNHPAQAAAMLRPASALLTETYAPEGDQGNAPGGDGAPEASPPSSGESPGETSSAE